MATYRLVPEEEWKRAVETVEALAKALNRAGTVIIPDAEEQLGRRSDPALLRSSGTAKDGARLAKQVIARVDTGGQRHQPKVFDRVGPKIADFVYLLTDSSFAIPDIIDKVSKYVVLKETRRDAGGQIRTAVRGDARFEPGPDGKYIKKSVTASER